MKEEDAPRPRTGAAVHTTGEVMEALLRKLRAGFLAQREQRKLYDEHVRAFRRRVRRLPRVFFPGSERSPEAVDSLANGAYVWFRDEPAFANSPAFAYVVDRELPARPFLYFWRASATMRFLRQEGPDELRDRCRLIRNLRIHLREGFATFGSRSGEKLWGLPEWDARAGEHRNGFSLSSLHVDLGTARGKDAIRRILQAAAVPLTRAEIAAVILENKGLTSIDEVASESDHDLVDVEATNAEHELHARQVKDEARSFYRALTARERALLKVRGYGDGAGAVRSWRNVARELDGRSAETYRLMERKVLEAFRDRFDPEDLTLAVAALAALIREDTL